MGGHICTAIGRDFPRNFHTVAPRGGAMAKKGARSAARSEPAKIVQGERDERI
ncbi:hypothetical protein WN48_05165 [Eufriesea mexicana]|nr:hypothetical protein WN48_05165 [Eufriesea mexicana]